MELASNSIIEKAETYVRHVFESQVPEEYVYHNYDHTMTVTQQAKELAEAAEMSPEEKEILTLSALFHDSGFSRSYDDHETKSIEIAREFLSHEGYPQEKIDEVAACIAATRMSSVPLNKLQMLIRDADTSGLGSPKFFTVTEKLRQELNNVKGENIDETGWGYINIQFFQDHTFYTEEARKRFGPTKKANLKEAKRRLGLKKKKVKKSKMLTISTSKSAQTQFKTALRNHIDLSAIADNKANTMLSVTSLIISLSLPILGTQLANSPHLIVPTVILLFVCVIAITYATLATRPIEMRGETTMEDIKRKRSNLFFFGNFYRMNYDEYEDGIRYVVAHDGLLDSAITRDLFYLGKALGQKYMYLRRCYNVFMYGMIVSVLAFTIAFVVHAWFASQIPGG